MPTAKADSEEFNNQEALVIEVMSPLKLPYGITTAVAGILMHSKNTKERHHVLPATHKVGLVISSDLLVKAASSSDHQQPQKAFLENL